MDRIVSISSNNNPRYLYYIPLVKWAWEQFGWETFVSIVNDYGLASMSKTAKLVEEIIGEYNWYLSPREYPSETVAQVCRMYASQTWPGDHLMMISDADMLPLSDYWKPDENHITCYGRDLSNEHQPMCYVAMPKMHWKTVMDGEENPEVKGIWWDLNHWYPKAKNKWTVDQNILTDRLKYFGKIHVDRGIDPKTHYPVGRVDRSSWTLNHKQLIDCHAPHDTLTNEASYKKVMELLRHVWPKEDFTWFEKYTQEFKKLI